jgi:hypothetical protein
MCFDHVPQRVGRRPVSPTRIKKYKIHLFHRLNYSPSLR